MVWVLTLDTYLFLLQALMYKLLIMCINKGAVIKTTEARKAINKSIFSFDWPSTFEGELFWELL